MVAESAVVFQSRAFERPRPCALLASPLPGRSTVLLVPGKWMPVECVACPLLGHPSVQRSGGAPQPRGKKNMNRKMGIALAAFAFTAAAASTASAQAYDGDVDQPGRMRG